MYVWKNMFLWCLQSFTTNDKECWENSERVTWHQRLKYSMTVWQEKIAGVLQKFTSVSEKFFRNYTFKVFRIQWRELYNFQTNKLYIIFKEAHGFWFRETSEISDCSAWNEELCKNYTSNIEQRVWTAHKTEKLFLYRNKCLYWSEVSEICFLGVNIIFYTKKKQIWIRSFVFLI